MLFGGSPPELCRTLCQYITSRQPTAMQTQHTRANGTESAGESCSMKPPTSKQDLVQS